MLTSYQLIYWKLWKVKKRSYWFWHRRIFYGCPHRSCLVMLPYFAPPWKPNSAKRWVIRGLFKRKGYLINALVPVIAPGELTMLVKFSWVLIWGWGPSDLPCIHYRLVCGALDHKLDYGWLWRWSKYGLNRLTLRKTLETFYSLTDKKWRWRQGELWRAEGWIFAAWAYLKFLKWNPLSIARWWKMSLFKPKFFSVGYEAGVMAGHMYMQQLRARFDHITNPWLLWLVLEDWVYLLLGSVFLSNWRLPWLEKSFLSWKSIKNIFLLDSLYESLALCDYYLLTVEYLFPLYWNFIKYNTFSEFSVFSLNNVLFNFKLNYYSEYNFLLHLYAVPFQYFNYDITQYLSEYLLNENFSSKFIKKLN